MPAPPPAFGQAQPDQQNSETMDPALQTLGEFFRAMLERYVGPAWANVAPSEDVVKTLKAGFDPEELDFVADETPTLALWRDGAVSPSKIADGYAQGVATIQVLWIAPPTDDQRMAARSPLFNAFDKTFLLALANERDPCWIKVGEEQDVTSRAYGSYVWGHAGIDSWSYGGLRKVPVVVPAGGDTQEFVGYLATWTITESTHVDPSQWGSTIDGERVGVEPTEIRFDETDRAPVDDDDHDYLVRQSALIPAETPEDED